MPAAPEWFRRGRYVQSSQVPVVLNTYSAHQSSPSPARMAHRAPTPQGQPPKPRVLRRPPPPITPQTQTSFSQMHSAASGQGPQTMNPPEQPVLPPEYPRPSSRQNKHMGPPNGNQGQHERPPSGSNYPDRPSSRQHLNGPPESRQHQYPPPEGHQHQYERPDSRQSHQSSYSRPSSRQESFASQTVAQNALMDEHDRRPSRTVRPPSRQAGASTPTPTRLSERQQALHPDAEGRAFASQTAVQNDGDDRPRSRTERPPSRHGGARSHTPNRLSERQQTLHPDEEGRAFASQTVAQNDGRDRPHSRTERPPSRHGGARSHTPNRLSERQQTRQPDAEGRAFRKSIADDTIAAINRGIPGVDVRNTQQHTKLFYEDDRDLTNWKRKPQAFFGRSPPMVRVDIIPVSTLKGARYISDTLQKRGKIGVLNFASATLPGGGFLTGARAQEESIARSSTLYVSLITLAARPFYAIHAQDDRRGFYTHSMIYSPDVHLLKDDDGTWQPPLAVDVLTSPAVNAGHVRRHGRSTPAKLEARIQEEMRERMARILALFEKKKARNLVLGSFGTGVFQNDVRAVAGIWFELLQAPGARFAGSFDHVVFAIPDGTTGKQFMTVFMNNAVRHE